MEEAPEHCIEHSADVYWNWRVERGGRKADLERVRCRELPACEDVSGHC